MFPSPAQTPGPPCHPQRVLAPHPQGLTLSRGAGFESQGGPEAGAVVEAPALLHFGGAALSRDVRAGGPPVAQRRLPALDTLAPRAGHAHALLKAELLAAGDRGGVSPFQAAPPTHLRQCADATVHMIDGSITYCITRNVSSK